MENNENKNGVNVNDVNSTPEGTSKQDPPAQPVKEIEPVKVGFVQLNLPKPVAKWARRIGKGLLIAGAAVAGYAGGKAISDRKSGVVIRSKNSEIDRLTADLAAANAPKLVDTIADTAEVVVDAVDAVSETVN